MTSNPKMTGGSGVGEATDKRPFSGPLESAPIRAGGPFSGPQCASCPASLAPGDGHRACFRCLGAEHAAAALAAPASCAACRALPEEGLLSKWATQCPLFPPGQHLFTAEGGDPSTLMAPVRAFTDFTNVEG